MWVGGVWVLHRAPAGPTAALSLAGRGGCVAGLRLGRQAVDLFAGSDLAGQVKAQGVDAQDPGGS